MDNVLETLGSLKIIKIICLCRSLEDETTGTLGSNKKKLFCIMFRIIIKVHLRNLKTTTKSREKHFMDIFLTDLKDFLYFFILTQRLGTGGYSLNLLWNES